MSKIVVGSRFGRLTVINPRSNKTKHKQWEHLCSCDCGALKNVLYSALLSGRTKSCGCLSKEKATIHGLSQTPAYKSWHAMMERCTRSTRPNYAHYGAVGIRIEDPRRFDVRLFFEDMGARPKGTSLDRIDGTKGYFKDNCRWASHSVQSINKKTPRNNKVKHKNISYREKKGEYIVRISRDNKMNYVGYYRSLEEAIVARNEAIAAYNRTVATAL